MSNKHLKRYPQHVHDQQDWWYYEEGNGLALVVDAKGAGILGHIVIPWRRIRAALKRKDMK